MLSEQIDQSLVLKLIILVFVAFAESCVFHEVGFWEASVLQYNVRTTRFDTNALPVGLLCVTPSWTMISEIVSQFER